MRLVKSLLIVAFLSNQLVLAQVTSGTISGVVKDASGAVIPGATVTLKNLDTGLVRTLPTNQQGRYQAPNLTLGNYEVDAEMAGFQMVVRRGIQLTVGREAVVDFTLHPGAVAEAVTVTAEAPIIDTTQAAISASVDERTMRELPLNARSFDQLVLLQAGVIQGRRGGEAGDWSGGGAMVSINGARHNQNSFLLDGTDANDHRNTIPGAVTGAFLGVDTVREFRVLTNSYSAEYGRSGGGVITAVTRSGTNALHGSAFEFLRNSVLDARDFFDRDPANPTVRTDPPPFKRNQFGFTAGGPIRKDQTFFFGSYEGMRQRLGNTSRATVPNELARQGFLPIGPGGALENVGVHEGAKPWLALYPLPTPGGVDFGNGTAEFFRETTQRTGENFLVVRVDHKLSSNHSVFARYNFDDAEKVDESAIPVRINPDISRSQILTVEGNSVLSPLTLNVARFGFNRSYGAEDPYYTEQFPEGLTFMPGVPFRFGGSLSIASLTGFGAQRVPRWFAYNMFEWSDDVTLLRGNHTLKTGLLVKRVRMNVEQKNATAGFYSFNDGLIAFLQGRPNRFLAQVPGTSPHRNWRQTFLGFYVQDDFKVRPNLTLNLGVREEFLTSPTDVHGRCANLPDVMLTEPLVGCPLFETFKFNLMPRVGFAWDALGNEKWALRGGFGLFYDQPFPTYWLFSGHGSPPFFKLGQIDNPPFPNAYALIGAADLNLGDLRPTKYTGTGYSMQYNFTIQTEILPGTAITVGYAGSQHRKVFRTGQMNTRIPTILPDGRQFFDRTAPRRNPKFGDVRIQQTDANGNYNALIASVVKKFGKGLQLQGSYTFSKIMSMADAVRGADFASGEHQVMDPYNPRLDRAPSAYSEKHNFSSNFTYDLPLTVHSAAGKLLNGWGITGIARISSGAPLSVLSLFGSDNGSSGSVVQERPNLAPGMTNGNPREGTSAGCAGVAPGQKLGGPDRYFDPCVFVVGQRGFYGTLGKNTIVGPELLNFDFSLVKNTPLMENTLLQFRAEFFNLFNRANFGDPSQTAFDGRGVRQPDAGRITATDTRSRQIQFALKLTY